MSKFKYTEQEIPERIKQRNRGEELSPSSSCSAAEKRQERYEMAMTYGRLQAYPECQPEAIANHYAACAMESMKLREMLKLKRSAASVTPELDECIQATSDRIKREYQRAFGIKLEWHNVQAE